MQRSSNSHMCTVSEIIPTTDSRRCTRRTQRPISDGFFNCVVIYSNMFRPDRLFTTIIVCHWLSVTRPFIIPLSFLRRGTVSCKFGTVVWCSMCGYEDQSSVRQWCSSSCSYPSRHISCVVVVAVLNVITGGRATKDIGNRLQKHLLSDSTALPRSCTYNLSLMSLLSINTMLDMHPPCVSSSLSTILSAVSIIWRTYT